MSTNSHCLIEAAAHPSVSQQSESLDVGDDLRDPIAGAEDSDREKRIQYHREEMERAMNAWEQSGSFADRGKADYHRIQFEREISARSPAQWARMQEAQRERMALEPGAARD